VHLRILLISVLASGLAGCGSDGGGDGLPIDAGIVIPPADAGFPKSPTARVKFKGADRLRNEFARILDIPAAEVCTEFGLYSCTDLVHKVALGGVEPYGLGLNEPLPFTTATTPLAVDRLALFACRTRVDQDLAVPGSAVIYSGTLSSADGDGVTGAITTLYERALLRLPKEAEVEELRQLHRDIGALGGATVERDWAIASCFAVTTTMEQLFY